MSFENEKRWSREYRRFRFQLLSRTVDLTLSKVEAEWPRWNQYERLDFCQALVSRGEFPDQAGILRFLMKNGDHSVWSWIALPVAMTMPQSEAVPFLKLCWLTGKIGRCANYLQALALTKTPDALGFLRDCFSQIWSRDGLMADAGGANLIAHEAIWCIKHMMELGEEIERLRPAYAALKAHGSAFVRDQTQRHLSEHFEFGL